MKRTSFLTISFIICFALLSPLRTAVAQDETPSPNIEVDHIAKGFEKVSERLTLFFKFSKKSKASHKAFLVEKRLAELKYAVDTNQIDLIEPTASRYSTYVGRLAEYVLNKNVTESKDSILSMFKLHKNIIESLQSNFEYDSGWWLAIQHDLNVLDEFSQKIQNI